MFLRNKQNTITWLSGICLAKSYTAWNSGKSTEAHYEIDMQHTVSGSYYLVVVGKDGKRFYWKLVKQ